MCLVCNLLRTYYPEVIEWRRITITFSLSFLHSCALINRKSFYRSIHVTIYINFELFKTFQLKTIASSFNIVAILTFKMNASKLDSLIKCTMILFDQCNTQSTRQYRICHQEMSFVSRQSQFCLWPSSWCSVYWVVFCPVI